MVVLIIERAKPSLRGEISRWLVEPRAGVFVGDVSAMVRDKLWQKVVKSSPDGGAIMIFNAMTEQGFTARIYGDTTRRLVDHEGLLLVRVPYPADTTSGADGRGEGDVQDST